MFNRKKSKNDKHPHDYKVGFNWDDKTTKHENIDAPSSSKTSNVYRIDKFLIPILVIVILTLIGALIFTFSISKQERMDWYKSHYYIYSDIENKTIASTIERKRKFQLRISGLLKDLKSTLTDKEIIIFTGYIFDKSDEYGLDPYLPIAIAFTESKFDKMAVGSSNDFGLYQFLPSTARIAASLAGIKYYRGIEFNSLDSTKLWFSHIKILSDTFDGNLHCILLAYNMGIRRFVQSSRMKINRKTRILDIKSGNLDLARKEIYYDNGVTFSYDMKIIKTMNYLKAKGTKEEISLQELFKEKK